MTKTADTILNMIKQNGDRGYTTKELRRDTSLPAGTVTGRASELAQAGKIKKNGRRDGAAIYILNADGVSVAIAFEIVVDTSSSMADGENNCYAEVGKRKCDLIQPLVDAQIQALGSQANVQGFYGMKSWRGCTQNGTPLYMETAAAIHRALARPGPRVVLLFTDGQATDWNNERALRLALQDALAAGDVTVAFMVPKLGGGRERLIAAGVPEGNIKTWGTIAEAKVAAEKAEKSFKEAVKRGARRTVNYFGADLSKVSINDIERDLLDVTEDTWCKTVDKETDIETFVSKKNYASYVPGTGFAEVMKKEKRLPVDSKLFLLNPATGRVYADGKRTVRAVCGYPKEECAIQPGNHAGFVIFKQSKSSKGKTFRARILPRGTRAIYWSKAGS